MSSAQFLNQEQDAYDSSDQYSQTHNRLKNPRYKWQSYTQCDYRQDCDKYDYKYVLKHKKHPQESQQRVTMLLFLLR